MYPEKQRIILTGSESGAHSQIPGIYGNTPGGAVSEIRSRLRIMEYYSNSNPTSEKGFHVYSKVSPRYSKYLEKQHSFSNTHSPRLGDPRNIATFTVTYLLGTHGKLAWKRAEFKFQSLQVMYDPTKNFARYVVGRSINLTANLVQIPNIL